MKKIAALIGTLMLTVGLALPAMAWNATLGGQASCRAADGAWSVTFTLTNTQPSSNIDELNEDGSGNEGLNVLDGNIKPNVTLSQFAPLVAGKIPGGASASVTLSYTGAQNPASVSLDGTVEWQNTSDDDDVSFTVQRPALCPPVTTTTQAPTTTTTAQVTTTTAEVTTTTVEQSCEEQENCPTTTTVGDWQPDPTTTTLPFDSVPPTTVAPTTTAPAVPEAVLVGELPFTGVDTGVYVVLAAGLIAGGLVLFGRDRNKIA